MKIARRTIWRGYDTVNKRWLDMSAMVRHSVYMRPDGVWTNGQNIIFMQFVGRHDITGKPIFEGDIIEVSVPIDFGFIPDKSEDEGAYPSPVQMGQNLVSYQKFHAVMIWSDPHMGFISHVTHDKSSSIPPQQVGSGEMQMKIVGNIVDTPHLLQELPQI